jgi:hypothetical protein
VTHKGSAHWLLPAVVGGAGGAVFLGFVGLCQNERGSNCPTLEATSGGVALGGTFAAALAGDRMDRVEMQLHVIPEKE